MTDGVEMSEEDGRVFLFRKWPRSVEKVEPEEGRTGEETVVRVEVLGCGVLEVPVDLNMFQHKIKLTCNLVIQLPRP